MKIKNKVSAIEIDVDRVIGFHTTCDPFKSNNHSLVMYLDSGTQETMTFFNLDEFRTAVDGLIDELKKVKQYKVIVNGIPRIDYNKRTKVKLEEKQRATQ